MQQLQVHQICYETKKSKLMESLEILSEEFFLPESLENFPIVQFLQELMIIEIMERFLFF